ncbi:MAG: oligosaccharide flippase family protein [Bacilli bacterium]
MKKSSFIEGTLIATIAIFIVKILGMLYVIPFYAMVGIQGSALYAYAYNIYNIFLDISTAGLPIALSKVIKEYDTLGKLDAKQRAFKISKQIIGIVVIAIFIILLIFAPFIGEVLVGELSGGNTIEDVAFAIRCVAFSILVVPFLSVSKGYLQGHNIINVSSISQIIEQVIRIAIILGGCYIAINVFNLSITHTIGIALSGAFIGALISYLYILLKMKRNKKDFGEVKENDNITNKEIGKKIISYSIPFIIINAIFSLYNFVDMVIVLRTMNYLNYSALDVEFISTSISTWAPKISIIITSVAMGMTTSLIPTIVKEFTLNNFKEVSNKLNQALKLLITIGLPMTVGLSLLGKPMWSIFYGIQNNMGYQILSISVFVAFLASIYMIVSSTLQSLNKFKLVYKCAILGLGINMVLDAPLMILFSKLNIPPYLGASTSSIIGYSISSLYALCKLHKEHSLNYKDTLNTIKKLILPIIAMIIVVSISKYFIPINYDNKFSCIIYIGINSIIGALVYFLLLIKQGVLKDVLGDKIYNRFLKRKKN